MDSRARLRALLCLVVCVLAHVEAAPVRSNEHRSFIVTCWNSSDGESTVAALAAPRPAPVNFAQRLQNGTISRWSAAG